MQIVTRWCRIVLVGMLALMVAACGDPTTTSQPAGNTTSETPQGTGAKQFAGKTLTLVTHDSFAISESVLSAFTEQTGAAVQIVKSGDAGSALNKSLLAKGAPLGDVQFGIDNTFFSRAIEGDIFEPYAPKGLEQIPVELRLDPENRLIPIDHGYVNINYDKQALADAKLSLPTELRDLTKPEWKGLLVVENPATSSPGLAFMLATVAHFGESGDYTWRNFWSDLRANDVKVAAGWEEAYYGDFSGGGDGSRPLVVSYATSPAAGVIFSETPLDDAPTGNFLPAGGAFRQIEFAGILKGTQQLELAQVWMDFMLGEIFQGDIGGQMFVYPVLPSAKTPPEFAKYAEIPTQPAQLDPAQIAANRDRWIEEWTETVLK